MSLEDERERIAEDQTPGISVSWRVVRALWRWLRRSAAVALLVVPGCTLRLVMTPAPDTLAWQSAVTREVNDHEQRLCKLEGGCVNAEPAPSGPSSTPSP